MRNDSGISKEIPVPLYVQLKEIIKKQIGNGKFKDNEKLPSERDMCKIYNISGITVRQALVDLTEEGLLFRVHGKGTYISPQKDLPQATNRTHCQIGFLIPCVSRDTISPFMATLLSAVKRVIAFYNYSLLIYTENESAYWDDIKEKRIQGLIVTDPQMNDARLKQLKQSRIPFVVIGSIRDANLYSVYNDEEESAISLTTHLLKKQCQKIGFINGAPALAVCQNKKAGYRKTLEKNGVKFDNNLLLEGDFSEDHGYISALKLLRSGVDAIICAEPFIAFGAIKALRKNKLNVPDDIALATFHYTSLLAAAEPGMIMVDIFPDILGEKAMEKLVAILQGRKAKHATLISTQLVDMSQIA